MGQQEQAGGDRASVPQAGAKHGGSIRRPRGRSARSSRRSPISSGCLRMSCLSSVRAASAWASTTRPPGTAIGSRRVRSTSAWMRSGSTLESSLGRRSPRPCPCPCCTATGTRSGRRTPYEPRRGVYAGGQLAHTSRAPHAGAGLVHGSPLWTLGIGSPLEGRGRRLDRRNGR